MIRVDETDPVGEIEPSFPYRAVTVRKGVQFADFYDIDSEVGRGKFGTVYRCKEKKSGLPLAAKVVNTSRKEDKRAVEREVEIMRRLQHPRLIQLYDSIDTGKQIYVILELIQGGELFERVIDDDFLLTERSCAVFMRQICEGIEFIHGQHILHLDMKPENILCLTKEGNRIKIIDFGLAREYDPKKKLQVLFGTPEFVAPEVVNFDQIGFGTDMWSIGVICYVLLSGLSPFMGDTDIETMANVTIAKYDFDDEAFSGISEDAKDFIRCLLVKDISKRIGASECRQHRWLTKKADCSAKSRLSKPRVNGLEGPRQELDVTKDNLRVFVERWREHPNSPYTIEMEALIEVASGLNKNLESASLCCHSPSSCESLSSSISESTTSTRDLLSIPNLGLALERRASEGARARDAAAQIVLAEEIIKLSEHLRLIAMGSESEEKKRINKEEMNKEKMNCKEKMNGKEKINDKEKMNGKEKMNDKEKTNNKEKLNSQEKNNDIEKKLEVNRKEDMKNKLNASETKVGTKTKTETVVSVTKNKIENNRKVEKLETSGRMENGSKENEKVDASKETKKVEASKMKLNESKKLGTNDVDKLQENKSETNKTGTLGANKLSKLETNKPSKLESNKASKSETNKASTSETNKTSKSEITKPDDSGTNKAIETARNKTNESVTNKTNKSLANTINESVEANERNKPETNKASKLLSNKTHESQTNERNESKAGKQMFPTNGTKTNGTKKNGTETNGTETIKPKRLESNQTKESLATKTSKTNAKELEAIKNNRSIAQNSERNESETNRTSKSEAIKTEPKFKTDKNTQEQKLEEPNEISEKLSNITRQRKLNGTTFNGNRFEKLAESGSSNFTLKKTNKFNTVVFNDSFSTKITDSFSVKPKKLFDRSAESSIDEEYGKEMDLIPPWRRSRPKRRFSESCRDVPRITNLQDIHKTLNLNEPNSTKDLLLQLLTEWDESRPSAIGRKSSVDWCGEESVARRSINSLAEYFQSEQKKSATNSDPAPSIYR